MKYEIVGPCKKSFITDAHTPLEAIEKVWRENKIASPPASLINVTKSGEAHYVEKGVTGVWKVNPVKETPAEKKVTSKKTFAPKKSFNKDWKENGLIFDEEEKKEEAKENLDLKTHLDD